MHSFFAELTGCTTVTFVVCSYLFSPLLSLLIHPNLDLDAILLKYIMKHRGLTSQFFPISFPQSNRKKEHKYCELCNSAILKFV